MQKVLYVPLDDRPVNLDDVIQQGLASGVEVIVPPSSATINRLDASFTSSGGQLTGTSNPTFGNPQAIRTFLLNNAAQADGFIIAADMLAFGGLIGSRLPRTSGGGTYPNFDSGTTALLNTIADIKQAYPNKPLYVIDTVVRLAATSYVQGLRGDAYNQTRSYMAQPRATRTTFESIMTDYNVAPNGSQVTGNTNLFNLEQTYNGRRFKFKSNRYVLEQLRNSYDYLFVGVDDSSQTGVQLNEIAYLENRASALNVQGKVTVMADADGLGALALARMVNHFRRNGATARVLVQFYGSGENETAQFEHQTRLANVDAHLQALGFTRVTSGARELDLLIALPSASAASVSTRVTNNGNNRIPTIVIDGIGSTADTTLTNALLDNQFTGRLMAYTSWNTFGNRLGIALGMGVARWAFIRDESNAAALNAAVGAHSSLLFKRFLKDFYYKATHADSVVQEVRNFARANGQFSSSPQEADQQMRIHLTAANYSTALAILRNRTQTRVGQLAARTAFRAGTAGLSYNVTRINGTTWSFAAYQSASIAYGNPDFLWSRAFEVTLSPTVGH